MNTVENYITPTKNASKGRNTNQLLFLKTVVMRAMMQHRLSLPFRKPVDADLLNLSDYHDVILEPMDFGTIKSRLEEKYYWSGEECVSDFKLVFNNCYTYNQPGEDIVSDAEELESFFKLKIAAMPSPEIEVAGEKKDASVVKSSRETLGLQDFLSSYFSPSPGVEVRSRRRTERTGVGKLDEKSSKKSKRGKGQGLRCGNRTSEKVEGESGAAGKKPKTATSKESLSYAASEENEVEVKEDSEVIRTEGENDLSPGATASYVTAKEQLDQDAGSPPSLVSKMAQNWKNVEAGAALQQTSANFKRRIVHVSKPFIDWGINAKRAQGLVKSAGLTGTALVHEKENMPANKNDAEILVHGDDKGRHMLNKEEEEVEEEEPAVQLNLTVGAEEAMAKGAGKVKRWLERDCGDV